MQRLSVRRIREIREPGRYGDGGGLYLEVRGARGRSWILRVTVRGRRRDIGLGSLEDVSLAEAREKAREMRRIARAGGDPLAERRTATRERMSFEEAARRVWAEQIEGHARNAKHAQQWINTLRDYAFPSIGARPVSEIEQSDVLRVLSPIWMEKPETARRVRQRLRTVMDWARTAGLCEGINPVDGVEKGLPRQRDRVAHFRALPWQQAPSVMANIGRLGGVGALALQFTILTAARSGEVRHARWEEIDWPTRIWTVPAERMKAGLIHRVPLSDEALTVLEVAAGLDEALVFPGARRGKPMSDMTLAAVLKRLDVPATVHGFRSTFRDWAAETSSAPREVAELCLAHQVGSAVERAYARSDLFEKRRTLMAEWGRWCAEAHTDVNPSAVTPPSSTAVLPRQASGS